MEQFTTIPEGFDLRFASVARRIVLETVIPRAKQNDPTDTTCCVALWMVVQWPVRHWQLVTVVVIDDGTLVTAKEKYAKYGMLAIEKGFRLSEFEHHISSFQSRGDEEDPDWRNRKYPGAVRMDLAGVAISTSGFDWPFDEFAGLLIGTEFGWISRDRVLRVIATSSNAPAREHFAG